MENFNFGDQNSFDPLTIQCYKFWNLLLKCRKLIDPYNIPKLSCSPWNILTVILIMLLRKSHRLKKIFIWGLSNCERTRRLSAVSRSWGSRGLAPGRGCKGAAPPWVRKFCILRAKYALFQALFSLHLQKYMIFGVRKGAALLFIHNRICILGNHKCTFYVPFLSKFIHIWAFLAKSRQKNPLGRFFESLPFHIFFCLLECQHLEVCWY